MSSLRPRTSPHGQHYSLRCARFRSDNAGLAPGAASSTRPFVLLGDSLVEAFDVGRFFPHDPFVNRGIISDRLDRGDGTGLVHRISPELLMAEPRRVLLLAGINDLADEPAEIDKHVATYERLLAQLALRYPEVTITIHSLLPTREAYAHLNDGIVELNRRLQRLAAVRGAAFVDLHALLRKPAARGWVLRRRYSRDGLHVNGSAYRIWAAALAPHLGLTSPPWARWKAAAAARVAEASGIGKALLGTSRRR